MSTDSDHPGTDAATVGAPSVDEAIRGILLLMPRLVARAKRLPIPPDLRSFNLAPRHLSLLGYLVFDGPLAVNELAGRLEVAPATVSLMVSDLTRQGVLERREDAADRRRAIVSIAASNQAAVEEWLASGAAAWRKALEPLTPAERQMFVDTLRTYEREMSTRQEDRTARPQ
jgi:DNA-binding MarR family transcriptional regulator